MSGVLSHQIFVNLLKQPQETNTVFIGSERFLQLGVAERACSERLETESQSSQLLTRDRRQLHASEAQVLCLHCNP